MTLWGGRFKDPLSEIAFRFSSSLDVDKRLFREDIAGSVAHVHMLGAQGILTADEVSALAGALEAVRKDIESGGLNPKGAEDIHSFIEEELRRRIGEVAGKLHTGRSRNDQIALDERLYIRAAVQSLTAALKRLQRTLLEQAERHADTILPGFTHLQHAQPVLLAHHLLAYVEMLARDSSRFADCLRRANLSPLGAGAAAGTSFLLDRKRVADELGFDGIVANSMDAVSDRDALIEFVSDAAIAMVHLSRLAEELVLWSSSEFGFCEIADAFTTGSSLMPQKKNPDMAELIRGKSSRVIGDLVALLTLLKGLPLAYNRDLQEDKPPLFDAHDTLESSLLVLSEMLAHVTFGTERMRNAANEGYTTATDLAEYLVRKGMAFRDAHRAAGEIVRYAIESGKPLSQLTLDEFRRFAPLAESDVLSAVDVPQSIQQKNSAGSTSPVEVLRQISFWRSQLQ